MAFFLACLLGDAAVRSLNLRTCFIGFALNDVVFCFLVSEFDVVCDEQAQAVKNSEAASQRHAAGLSNEGVAPPEGDDSQDEGGAGVPAVAEVVA